jgi:Flp pilus assembly protein TadG
MMIARKLYIKSQNGQSLVEFALLLPVLVLIVFGIIEWGRLWMTMNVLTGAAREGVRVAAVTAPDNNLVQTAVSNVLTAANINGATITTAGPNAASEVTVTVQMNYTVFTGSIIPGLNGTLQLTRSAIMRWEG